MKKIQKRYIILIIAIAITGILIWQLSTSYASIDIGYSGKNIVSGDKWGINIIDVEKEEIQGDAVLTSEISTIGTTLNFNVLLTKPGDSVSFNFTVQNTSNLPAELYALTLSGLSNFDSENITYTIMPIDSSIIHEDDKNGSIIKTGEKQMFNIKVNYDDTINPQNAKEYNLGLGSTIIYKQK